MSVQERLESSLDSSSPYLNRELSLLAFQQRVLEEAQDKSNPLLERFKFLSIVGSNLEEFFMVRVAGLKRQLQTSNIATAKDGMTVGEQLQAIREAVVKLVASANYLLKNELLPALNEAGIDILTYKDLTPKQREQADSFFNDVVFPVLTPLAFDPGHPFPHISNLSFNMAVLIKDSNDNDKFARIKIPEKLTQLIPLQATDPTRQSFIWLDDVISGNLDDLFPGMTVVESHPFALARDAAMEIQEWEAEDLLELTEEGIRQREFGDVVRLTVQRNTPAPIIEILTTNLEIGTEDVYAIETRGPLSSLKHVFAIDRPDLKDPPFVPNIPAIINPDLQEEDIFSAIRRQDILLHHPYDSFMPVVNFFNAAAQDPNVLAIKTTLYRVGKNSPIVQALLEASTRGKEVAALVELKARFDEENNVEWARALEREGVHVVYGLPGLKVHSKVTLVVRQEGNTIRRYMHLSTGNYNAVTAHLYTDIGLLTCNEEIGSDVTDLFNYLTGYSAKQDFRKLLVAPINLSEKLTELIRREIELHKQNGNGRLIFKMNSLVEPPMIDLLYEASRAGVKIDLIVRGICCLLPGVAGISENINVTSIVGRFLEHSRIYYFGNGGKEEIYLGSADLMPRNLHRRVEVVFPILDERILRHLKDDILKTFLADCMNAQIMTPHGNYTHKHTEHGPNCINCQQVFMSTKNSNTP
ncbi:MAG: polyphosphate kinase 1 [Candidatus Obscuribacterales bacterium]|nr:polyphosphate kinase 1 [Candidatus Obscuribacterales bacterium]